MGLRYLFPFLLLLGGCAEFAGAAAGLGLSALGDFQGVTQRTAVRDYERQSGFQSAITQTALTVLATCVAKAQGLPVDEYLEKSDECISRAEAHRPPWTLESIVKGVRNAGKEPTTTSGGGGGVGAPSSGGETVEVSPVRDSE